MHLLNSSLKNILNCIIKHSCEKHSTKFAYYDEASYPTGIGWKRRNWRLKFFEVSSKASSRDHVVESDTVTVFTRNGLENKAILIEILDHRDREWSSKKTVTTKL